MANLKEVLSILCVGFIQCCSLRNTCVCVCGGGGGGNQGVFTQYRDNQGGLHAVRGQPQGQLGGSSHSTGGQPGGSHSAVVPYRPTGYMEITGWGDTAARGASGGGGGGGTNLPLNCGHGP